MVNKTRSIGIAVNPPETVCHNDKHCPFHGEISLRGRIIKAKVVRAKVAKNALVEWNWLKKIPKFERYEKKRTRIMVHNPSCIGAKEGDMVKIMETRKISKTKSFVIVEKLKGEQI
jgi:small subunit ribosomal protein S17